MSAWELTSWVARPGEPGPQLGAWVCRGHAAVSVASTESLVAQTEVLI